MKTIKLLFVAITAAFLFQNCEKGFLDRKARTDLLIPNTLPELQQLLDNHNIMNATGSLSQLSADEYYYLSEALWSAATVTERNAYIWAPDIFEGTEGIRDWDFPYTSIFYANNVLERLRTIEIVNSKDSAQHDLLKGWALFSRAYSTFDLLKNFAPAYREESAATDLGVPLRLTPGVDDILPRASVQECYRQILDDMAEAEQLLPLMFNPEKRYYPSKLAVHAFLARLYLYTREYELALSNAEKALAIYGELMDYNTINRTVNNPFPRTNAETIFSTTQVVVNYTTAQTPQNTRVAVDTTLIAMYHPDDLRLSLFFGRRPDSTYYKKQGYNEANYPFSGLATDELYLIKSECLARDGLLAEAATTLGQLLTKRYNTDKAPQIAEGSAEALLQLILQERRKELVWRGIRWMDLKRLNLEGFDIGLSRELNGKRFDLPPNDPRWVFPIPDEEITRSNIQQNKR